MQKNEKSVKEFTEQELKKFGSTLGKLNAYISKEPQPSGIRTTNKFLKWYAIPTSLLLIFMTFQGMLWFSKTIFIYKVIVGIFTIPVGTSLFIYHLVRLYIDKNTITGEIRKRTSQNYLIMNFFRPQKRVIKQVGVIDNKTNTVKLKDQIYGVDYEAIWIDSNGYMNSYYLPNIFAPIKFNIKKVLDLMAHYISIGEPNKAIDDEGNKLNITFSPSVADEFKKDKIFKELHTTKLSSEHMILFYTMAGIVGFLILAIIVLILVMK